MTVIVTPEIAEETQITAPSPFVTLFRLDATNVGGDVACFVQGSVSVEPIVFGGVTYYPAEVEAEGFEWNSTGSLPTPKLRVGNANGAFTALVVTHGDLLGATVTRIRTFEKFLDGKPDADPTAIMPLDVYRIERKSAMTGGSIEFELSAAMDQEGKSLPGRQILRNGCTHSYRVWTGSAFNYANSTCPYTGSAYFEANGTSTANASLDRCGKRISDCKKRFGENNPLPTRSFPGVARTRV